MEKNGIIPSRIKLQDIVLITDSRHTNKTMSGLVYNNPHIIMLTVRLQIV